LQRWKIQDWKMADQFAGLENADYIAKIENAGSIKCAKVS